MAPKTPTDITLYTVGTPNGIKVSILLEELQLEYKVHKIAFDKNEQKEDWFLAINPNGRIPAITDKDADGSTIRVFESGAILEYLVAKYDKDHKLSYPYGSKEHWEVISWLMWQMGGLGPMQGQANHFSRYAPEKIQYGIDRYVNETRRLYRTMDTHLAKSPSGYLVGDRVTIADISCWGWVAHGFWAGVNIDEFPALKKWLYKLLERPGFEAGRNVPTRHTAFEQMKKSAEELDKDAEASKAWVQAGMKQDAQK
jgi:glutathione S-transferase